MSSSAIVQKLWNYCNVLRDDGMSYGDYVEQLTYLLFIKMADERTGAPCVVDAVQDWAGCTTLRVGYFVRYCGSGKSLAIVANHHLRGEGA